MNELLVEFDTFFTRDAAKRHQHRFASSLGLGETRGDIVIDPKAAGFDLLAVVADLFIAGLCVAYGKAANQGNHR
jgi:hypothetical protein